MIKNSVCYLLGWSAKRVSQFFVINGVVMVVAVGDTQIVSSVLVKVISIGIQSLHDVLLAAVITASTSGMLKTKLWSFEWLV